jgi:hypothetical protein
VIWKIKRWDSSIQGRGSLWSELTGFKSGTKEPVFQSSISFWFLLICNETKNQLARICFNLPLYFCTLYLSNREERCHHHLRPMFSNQCLPLLHSVMLICAHTRR